MRPLLYLPTRNAEPPAVPDGPPRLRCAKYWSGETEPAGIVYTDDPAIAEAYEAAGADVAPLPSEGGTEPDRRYEVGNKTSNGWWPVVDTEREEAVDGQSARSQQEAKANADALEAQRSSQ